MYVYIFKGVNLKIKTPEVSDFSQIKKELISQTAEKIVMRFVYPNGFEFTAEQEAGQTTIFSNRLLIQHPDGSYSVSES